MKRFIVITLLLFAVYTPISLFMGLPPFGLCNEVVYEYEGIPPEVYDLPGVIAEAKSWPVVRSTVPIENPGQYGLKEEGINSNYTSNSPWYYPTVGIFVGAIIAAVVVGCIPKRARKEKK